MPSLPRCIRRPLSFAALFLSPLAALAVSPPNRIASVDNSSRGAVAHNVAGRTKAAADLGQAPSGRRMEGITLFFSRTAAQQTALDQLMVAQQTPGSPQYHKWLTPTQFGQQFGLSAADLAKVRSWLTAQGLAVSYVAPSNSLITVGGTVAQVQQAFGTSIHSLLSRGEQHIGNVSDPIVPAAIANVVSGIGGLNDFKLVSHARSRVVPAPAFTSAQGANAHYLAPADFQIIYDSKPLLAAAVNGTGATIAVMGQTDISLPEVAAFRSAAGLPAQTPQVITATTTDPGSQSGDIPEAQLDVEWAGSSAPNAQIIYVNSSSATASGAFSSLQFAITEDVAPILSISYGNCEPALDAAFVASFSALLQQGNVQGQTIIAPAGDAGATDCDADSVSAADGLAVDFPASSPYATAVGGTMFNDTASPTSYWQSTTGTTDQVTSALGYIPEAVWNEYASFASLASGGGGASVYFTKPVWQVGNGVPADLSRDVPDIALNAGANHDGYLYCVPVVTDVTTIASCSSGFRDASGGLTVVGGTSAGVPSFSSLLALVEQKIGATTGLGNINPKLYGLGGTSAFHDITTGNNNSPCVSGAPDCQTANTIGFSAVSGYDLATGWGSIDAYNLANAWTTAVSAGGASTTGALGSVTTVQLPPGAQSCGINSGSITISVSVQSVNASATSAIPTGSVQMLIDGAAVGGPVTLTGGGATITYSTAGLSSGAHNVAAVYLGDPTFAPSKSYLAATVLPNTLAPTKIIDIVSTTVPDFALSPCLPAVSVASGGTSAPVTLTVSSFNGFGGPVTFTASTDSSLAAGFTFSAPSVTVSSSTPGTATLSFSAFTSSTNAVGGSGLVRRPASGTASMQRTGLISTGAGAAALASVLFLALPRRRRFLGLLVAILSVSALGLSGCGSGATPINGGSGTGTGTTTSPTPVGTYLVNVTASGTNSTGQALVHTVILTLNVTQ